MQEIHFLIPDEIARRVINDGGDPSRRALEAFGLEELRAGRISEAELGEMLGLGRLTLDAFLQAHGVGQEYTLEEFESERQALREIGL